jgi:putative spermidine/putrescine transport system ATP-binding protein
MSGDDLKLKIRSLRKTYGPVVALDSADIDMRTGEFLTLLGPSGSGKSTLLWAVAGLNDPDAGQIWIDGREATHLPPFMRGIGMVFQNYALFPHMTIGQNIGFPLEMRKMNRANRDKAIARVLDMVKLGHVADRYPRELSGGQQQRIALARAFVYEPSIILMDEPLGALDKKLRDHLQLEIKHLHEQLGVTVMYVTHDQEEAMVMSDRICLMNDARIEQIGTPEDLYFRPVSVFAADFLGESNLVDGVVREMKGDGAAVEIGGAGVTSALPNGALATGEKVKLMTRPEAVDVLVNGATRPNEVNGTVREIIVGGGVTKLFVELPGGATMRVNQLTRGAAERLSPGADVRLGWEQHAAVVLKHAELETEL